jgi:hypothetical protein
MKFTLFSISCLLFLSALRLNAQSPQDAALIDAASQMNFIDRYRNETNGTYVYGIPGHPGRNEIPESFFKGVPYFRLDDYSYIQGSYSGKTLNRLNNKYGDTWLTLGNIDADAGTICVKAGWYNGLVGEVHLEAPMSGTSIFSGEGLLYYNGRAMFDIYMFFFMLDDWKTMKGVCVLNPRTSDGVLQTSTFVLKK